MQGRGTQRDSVCMAQMPSAYVLDVKVDSANDEVRECGRWRGRRRQRRWLGSAVSGGGSGHIVSGASTGRGALALAHALALASASADSGGGRGHRSDDRIWGGDGRRASRRVSRRASRRVSRRASRRTSRRASRRKRGPKVGI